MVEITAWYSNTWKRFKVIQI